MTRIRMFAVLATLIGLQFSAANSTVSAIAIAEVANRFAVALTRDPDDRTLSSYRHGHVPHPRTPFRKPATRMMKAVQPVTRVCLANSLQPPLHRGHDVIRSILNKAELYFAVDRQLAEQRFVPDHKQHGHRRPV